jgi:protein SCO1/2
MNLERPTAALRRLFVVAWLLWLPACGGAAADAPAAGNDSYARRAAAQLEVEALPGTGGGPYAGRELDLPLVPPDFVLADTAGEPFDFARDATRPVTLLYFGYASCPDVCPAHMAAISKALSQMPAAQADQVQVLFVSVDTVNDTPETLGDYLDNFADPGSAKLRGSWFRETRGGAFGREKRASDRLRRTETSGPDFVGLTGTADQVNAALQAVGLPPTAISDTDQFPPQHPSDVLAYTADHRARVTYPFGTPPGAYVEDLPKLISADWNA